MLYEFQKLMNNNTSSNEEKGKNGSNLSGKKYNYN